MALIFGMEVTDRHGSMLLGVGYAWALPSMPGHDPHVPIWANFVVYGPILKISNSMCISNRNLEFSDTAQLCSDLANSLPLALLRLA